MGSLKVINIKNRTYYFYNDILDIEMFDSSMLKLDKKTYQNLDIYNIGYATIKKIGYGHDIKSVNLLYLRIHNANGYTEEINEDKHLICDITYETKKLLERFDDVFNGIMDKIKKKIKKR